MLHDYQWLMVAWILSRPSCALWVEMGLGKTVATLTALVIMLADYAAGRVLVVAPLRVARSTWPAEIRRWLHTRGLVVVQLAGLTPAQRRKALQRPAHIHLINRELLPWLRKECGADWPFDTVVLDEAADYKSPGTHRFKALRHLVNKGLIRRVIELTGTPAAGRGLQDLWGQMYLLDRGQRLLPTYQQFMARYFIPTHDPTMKRIPRRGAGDEIHRQLGDLCLTLRAADYLELPERIILDRRVELPPKAREAYQRLEREFLVELEGAPVSAFNAGALTAKLLQAANGQVYDDDGNAVELHAEKLDELAELLDEVGDEPVFLAYSYRSDVPRIRARFPQAVVLDKDPATLDRWNAGAIPLLLAHPASAGHGLNMAAGGAVLVFYGLPWSLELYQQTIARLHRQGQTRPVRVVRLVAADTAEDSVLRALSQKNRTQNALLDALRADAIRRNA